MSDAGVMVAECDEPDDADWTVARLAEEGIAAHIQPVGDRFQVTVSAEDAEPAKAFLAADEIPPEAPDAAEEEAEEEDALAKVAGDAETTSLMHIAVVCLAFFPLTPYATWRIIKALDSHGTRGPGGRSDMVLAISANILGWVAIVAVVQSVLVGSGP